MLKVRELMVRFRILILSSIFDVFGNNCSEKLYGMEIL